MVSEKNMAINKDNQILLSKLVEIQSGKYSSLPRPKTTVSPAAASTLAQGILKMGSKKALLQEAHALRQSENELLKRNQSTKTCVTVQGSGVSVIRSLNFGTRKRETERIERENHAFAKRLFEQQANYKSKQLHEGYRQHLRLKKQIQKVESIPTMTTQQVVVADKRFKVNS